ncbi:hypothetical protein LOTGIDRAFT_171875 [Lottia gigantea]|uniref:Uncharacterized protein n=1 Tax=Lottia gigantea TaxID=225164 RepID=V4CKA8_LOTGI|nr:hypothetical protein LOTGIDRAFT_171875 [Lottia gigantea]ESP02675.1 hypothetical protein LOTGIDRAFT_171875 [Lottia gigantea]
MASKWKELKTHPSLGISPAISVEEKKSMVDVKQSLKEPSKKPPSFVKKILGKAGKRRINSEMEKNLAEFHSSSAELKNVGCGKKSIRWKLNSTEITVDEFIGSSVTESTDVRNKPKTLPVRGNNQRASLTTVDENKVWESCSPRKRRKVIVGDSSYVTPEAFLELPVKGPGGTLGGLTPTKKDGRMVPLPKGFGAKSDFPLVHTSKDENLPPSEQIADGLKKKEQPDGTSAERPDHPREHSPIQRNPAKHKGVKCFQMKSYPARQVIYYQQRFMVLDTIPITAYSRQNTTATVHASKQSFKCSTNVVQASNNHDIDRIQSNQSVLGLDGIDSIQPTLVADVVTRSSEIKKKRVAQRVSADDSNLVSSEIPSSSGACCAVTTGSCSSNMEMDASSVTMDARAIEIVVTDEADRSRKVKGANKDSIWKRISRVLIDNRMTGQTDCDRILRPHPEENIVLKRILNVVFIVIGVCLLVAVFIVIIYTAIVCKCYKIVVFRETRKVPMKSRYKKQKVIACQCEDAERKSMPL